MNNSENSSHLFEKLKQGDQFASEELFHRYLEKLIFFARNRLATKLASRVDPEDIVMSAFRSFFVGTKAGQFSISHSGDLWKLLISITHHKLLKQVRRETASKRNVDDETTDSQSRIESEFFRIEPGPEEIIQFADELENIFSGLDADSRKILELRLQDETFDSIAKTMDCSERTIRRAMEKIKEKLKHKFNLDNQFDSLFNVSNTTSQRKRYKRTKFDIKECSIPIISFDDLILQKLIGEGGSGKVYLGKWKSKNRQVAIKFLKKRWQTSQAAMQKFLIEANIIGQLNHANIIPIHGFGQSEAGACFLVIEWIDGPNLTQQAKSKKLLTNQIIDCILQVSRAIQHIHDKGLIHCDLKPENILVQSNQNYIVTDFGLARSLTDIQNAMPLLEGTAAYMAPEQISDWWGSVSQATDIYGLGAILYELLTNSPPVAGDSIPQILTSIVSAKPIVAPKTFNQEISSSINAICMKSLSKHQEDRYTNISELISDLESLNTKKKT